MRTIVTVVAGVVAAVLLLWIVLAVFIVILRPERGSLRESVRIVPDAIRLVTRLSRVRTLPSGIRIRLLLLVGYLVIPIDVVPDFIPVLGYADDAIVIGVVLRGVIRRAGPDIVRTHWPGTDTGLDLLARLCRIPALRVPGLAPDGPDHTSTDGTSLA
jgi:uncharacterized membrane protein YkvA (DUF1232 family)